MAGKKFAAEFALRRNVSAQDKILIQDSDDDVVKYAYPPQIASLSGYAYAQSVADLPLLPSNKSIGYIVGQMLYIYVGMGGDTKDGLYQSVGFFVGPQGVQGEKGEKGEQGEQGVQGPKGDNGGLSLQELDDYLATKQYVTGDTLADMLAGYVSNTSLMRDYVTIAKAQDVTGVKNFTAGVQFGGLSMYKSKGDTVYLDANLVVRGGVTAFGTNETISPSIFEALPIDGATLKRTANGVLYVDTNVVGGGGSGGGSVDPSQLEAYLKPYAKTADVASTYATIASLSAVTSRLNDFLSGSDTDAIINKWSELETFLAGLAETDNLATILSGKANKATTLAGYGITDAYTKSHIDSNFVTIGTKQEITGEKDFVGGFKVNGGLVEYNATLKTWVFNGDLLVTGGMAAFSNISGFKPLTITDAVLIDDRTIKRNADGLLYAVDQGAGGINEDQLEEYLRPYATQSWVTGRGYLTGITGAMVANALGYTPYNSSNPAGYITSSGSITGNAATATKLATTRSIWGQSFDGSTDVSGNIFPINTSGCYYNENGISYHTNKQYQASILRVTSSYNVAIGGTTASEKLEVHGNVKATSFIGSLSGNAATSNRLIEEVVTDLNNATPGRIFTMTSGFGSTDGNKPTTGWVTGLTLQYAQSGTYRRQLAFCDDLYFRRESNAIWDAWRKILDDSNYSEYALPITGGTVNGNVRINKFLAVGAASSSTNTARAQIHLVSSGANPCDLYFGADDTLYWSVTVRNASDAGGFNKAFALYDVTSAAYRMMMFPNGNLALGGTTASEKLHVYGNVLATGGITATNSSDERLKRNIRKFNASEVLMSLGGVWEYEYIDSEVQKNHIYEGTHYGLIYQHVKGTKLDVMCHEREDGMGALNYIHPKFISLIAGATMENISEIEQVKRENRELRKELEQLKQRVA